MQIAAPSNELMPPMSMVRFDWIGTGQNARVPVQTLRVVQGQTAAGNAEGSCRSEEHTSELQSLRHLVCRLLLEKKKKTTLDRRRRRREPPPVSIATSAGVT